MAGSVPAAFSAGMTTLSAAAAVAPLDCLPEWEIMSVMIYAPAMVPLPLTIAAGARKGDAAQ